MGEENTFAGVGTTCFFCKREDIGTDREKWEKLKIKIDECNTKLKDFGREAHQSTHAVQSFSSALKDATKSWATSLPLTATIECDVQFYKLVRGMKKHQSGLRHYVLNTMSKPAKKALRKCHLHMKKYMFKKKQYDH